MGQFAEIRPYYDDEVFPVIERLLADREFIASIASLQLGSWHKPLSAIIYPVVRLILRRELKQVKDVRSFQTIVKKYLTGVVDSSTCGFSCSGLDKLDPAKPYLFISNHRDIALDPAFVNYALYQNNHDTVRIAIGDNLLTKPFVSDLMRLNKSFIVRRSAKGARQVFAAYKLLSSYIRHSIEEDNNPIWIAQREGRAKDGRDRTEPAIIKMIAMSRNKREESFSEFINKLHIVPIAISYELDPCDGSKAQELFEIAQHGGYQKGEHEDVESIARGISGDKGHVHVTFGDPLEGVFDTPEVVSSAIDRQVIDNYVLHPTNFFAYKMLYGEYPEGVYSHENTVFSITGLEAEEEAFQRRINALPVEHQKYALGIYANTIDLKRQNT